MEKIISVIVPVYKVERYLLRCVDSILKQSFKNFELILVDDGSPDHCPEICDMLEKQDSRIVVLHKANGGLASARNAGIEIAGGKFLAFVDGDDYIHPQMLEILYTGIETYSANISICKIEPVFDDEECRYSSAQGVFSEYQYAQRMVNDTEFSVCAKLFRREVFEEIRFPVGRIFEDQFVIFKLLRIGASVETKDKLYYYYQRFDGLSKCDTYKEHYDYLYSIVEVLNDIPREESACRAHFANIAFERVSTMLGNVFYQEGQYRNCNKKKIAAIVKDNYSLLSNDICFAKKVLLKLIASGRTITIDVLSRMRLHPIDYISKRIKK